MSDRHGSAVVVGASIAGLLAARALSAYFDQITIIERDRLPEDPAVRKGVPQAAHAHGLLASGYRVIDGYFPGLMDELEALGAPRGDVVGDFLWFQYGRWKLRYAAGLRGITVSRPFLETAIRRRVGKLPNVRFVEEYDAIKPCFDAAAGSITGIRVKCRDQRAEETMAADLVVDATGRGSQSPAWLQEWGFGQPKVITVKIDVGYGSRIFERKPGDFFNPWAASSPGPRPATRETGRLSRPRKIDGWSRSSVQLATTRRTMSRDGRNSRRLFQRRRFTI
jgi:2-polyprenyl-6-methoxyphenol hydroxylase-like FAD-dependent oxidoreductase